MVDLARRTSAILKVHNILMTEPAFRWPYWARIRANEPLELSKHMWRRQELNSENEMVQILLFSNISLFGFHGFILIWPMSSKRFAGPLVILKVTLFAEDPDIFTVSWADLKGFPVFEKPLLAH